MKGSAYPISDPARNHHDGWVFGGSRSMSGHIALMAEARPSVRLRARMAPEAYAGLLSWDAEEPMLLAQRSGPRRMATS